MRRAQSARVRLGFAAALVLLAAVSHAAGAVQYVYDEIGRLIAAIDPAGATTLYVYDDAGNLLSVSRQPSGQVSVVAFVPARGRVGDRVAVYGTGFGTNAGDKELRFGGTPAIVESATATEIVTRVPAGASTGPISVTTPLGSAASSAPFTVTVVTAPQITSLSPTITAPGRTVDVLGTGFEPEPSDNTVTINTSRASVLSVEPGTLRVRVPLASGGRLTVQNSAGSATSLDDLFVVPPPHLTNDVIGTGRIEIGGQSLTVPVATGKLALVLFDGIAGAVGVRVSVSGSSGAPSPPQGTITAYGPNGTAIGSVAYGTFGGTTSGTLTLPTLPETGTYSVLITDTGSEAANLSVAAWRDVSGELLLDTPFDLVFSHRTQVARLTFTGALGQNLGIDVSAVTLPSGSAIIVRRPDGVIIRSAGFGGASDGLGLRIGTLSMSGTYTVEVTPASVSTGSVRLLLWRDVTGELSLGTPLDLVVSQRAQIGTVTFQGEAGQSLGIDVSAVTLPSGSAIIVRRPDGVIVSSAGFGGASAGLGLRIPALGMSGTYTVEVTPASPATGTVRLLLWSDITGPLAVGDFRNVTLLRNQQLTATFTGEVGQNLGVDVAELTGDFSGGTVIVTRPDAIVVASSGFGDAGVGLRIPTLGMPGPYRVIVTPTANAAGSLRVMLWSDVTDPLSVGASPTVTLLRNQHVRMPFTGTTGQNLGVDVAQLTGGFGGGTVTVTRPDSIVVASSGFSGAGVGLRIPTLGSPGEYTVIVAPSANQVGSLQVMLWSDVTDPLSVGGSPTVALLRNQHVRMPFTGTTGQNLGVDVAQLTGGFGGGTVTVTRPDSIVVASSGFGAAGVGLRIPTLGTPGEYTVIVAPTANATGSLRVTLWSDVTDALEIGTPYALQIVNRGQFGRNTFTGTSGQNLAVELSGVSFAGGGGSIAVRRPGDGVVVSQSAFGAAGVILNIPTLGVSGEYTVVVSPANAATGAVTLRVFNR